MNEDPVSIGRFLIEGALGRGAMGSIYRAHDPDIDRPVAIKLIRADLLESADRADFIARFRREAQAAGRCTHPNIVAIYDFALHQGNPYLAMEFVNGVTLAQARPSDGRFSPEDAIFVILQVLAALQAAHAAGIVHRDIKPGNIMLVEGTQVKVADFGIARINSSNLTQHDAVIGTPSYMSPEHCSGQPVDNRSDLFSVGVVLFEMLAGYKPFKGAHSIEVWQKIVLEPAPDLRTLVPEAGDALCAVVARSLAKSPAERYVSASEMAKAVKAAAASSGASYDDRTIVAPLRPAAAEGRPTQLTGVGTTQFDPQLISTLSRKLAELLGPMAPYLVQSAAQKATTVEDLCAQLENQVERPADRLAFQQEVRRQLGRTPASAVGDSHPSQPTAGLSNTAAISPADIGRLQPALARHLGPMARVVVKRAVPGAPSLQVLKETLAAQITDENERLAFLRE